MDKTLHVPFAETTFLSALATVGIDLIPPRASAVVAERSRTKSLMVRLSRLAIDWARLSIASGKVTDRVRVLLVLSIAKHDLA